MSQPDFPHLTRRQALASAAAAAVAAFAPASRALGQAAPSVPPAAVRYTRPDGPTLRELAEARGLRFGGNFPHLIAGKGPNNLARSPVAGAEKDIAADHFNTMCSGWETFPGHSWRAPGEYSFDGTEHYLRWCAERGIAFHGHGLAYVQRTPWFTELPADTEEERQRLRDLVEAQIRDTATRFKGRIEFWDVANEHLGVHKGYNASGYSHTRHVEGPDGKWVAAGPANYWRAFQTDPSDPDSGVEFVRRSFELAHEADPAAKLVYLDFNNEVICPKSDQMVRLVEYLRSREAPLHGVGFQMHLGTSFGGGKGLAKMDDDAYFASMRDNLQRFADLGCDLYVTELEVNTTQTGGAAMGRQAEVYGRVMRTLLAQPRVKCIKLWTPLDHGPWGPNARQPGLFDAAGRAKPAFDAVRDALAG